MDLFFRFADEFTEDDREGCIETVQRVLTLAETARSEGLLALES